MQSNKWNRRLTLPMQLLMVTVFSALIGLFLAAINHGSHRGSLVINVGISNTIGLSIWILYTLLDRKRWIDSLLVRAVLAISGGSMIGGMAGGLLFLGEHKAFDGELFRILLLGTFFGSLGLYIIYSQLTIYRRREQLAEERRKLAQQELQFTQSRLQQLQSQIEPHFLFNTLANIHSRIDTVPAEAKVMMEHLTHILRFRLKSTQQTVSLADEIGLIDDYLAIQQLRLGDRLRYTIEFAQELSGCPIPPLLIQPLVENAVTHGIEPKVAGGHIDVQILPEGEQLTISVVDDGVGLGNSPRSGSGIALTNIRERLNTLYGAQAQLTLSTTAEGTTQSAITLPWGECDS